MGQYVHGPIVAISNYLFRPSDSLYPARRAILPLVGLLFILAAAFYLFNKNSLIQVTIRSASPTRGHVMSLTALTSNRNVNLLFFSRLCMDFKEYIQIIGLILTVVH